MRRFTPSFKRPTLKIKTRLLIMTLLSIMSVLVLFLLSVQAIRNSKAALSSVYETDTVTLLQLERMDRALQAVRFDAAGTVLGHLPLVGSKNRLHEIRGELGELWQNLAPRLNAEYHSEEARSHITAMEQGWPQVDSILASLAQAYESGDAEELEDVLEDDWAFIISNISKPLQGMLTLADARSQATFEQAISANYRTLTVQSAVAAIILLILLVMPWRIGSSIIRPLREVGHALEQISRGGLNCRIPAARGDELGGMIQALGRMRTALRELVATVRNTAEHINDACHQQQAQSRQLGARAEDIASNLTETAASLEQLSATTAQSSSHAEQANEAVTLAVSRTTRGGQTVDEALAATREIAETSKQIEEITDLIQSIAFQTNILALNAAVEAARAGAHGQGFSVVAGEIRALAVRSSEAADKIKQVIDHAVAITSTGSSKISEVGTMMAQIMDTTGALADSMGEIAIRSKEQSLGVAQINTAVSNIEGATASNHDMMQEMQQAAEQLSGQARTLVQQVALFRLDDDRPSDGSPAASAAGFEKEQDLVLAA